MNHHTRKLSLLSCYDQKASWDSIAYSYLADLNQVLDVGCGEGRFLAQNPETIVGIDWNFESIHKCKRAGYNVVEGDVRSLPFQDESFQGIHCSHILEHFQPSGVHKILSELDRVLAPHGVLAIRGPVLYDEFYSDLTHVRPYNPDAILRYLTPAKQRTLQQINTKYELVHLRWRYAPIRGRCRLSNMIGNRLSRWGFPWLKRTGYLMIVRKGPRGTTTCHE